MDRKDYNSLNLSTYKPKLKDLWFRQKMLSDERTMEYNHAWGGTIEFPKEQWTEWYDHWVANAGTKRYYRFLKNAEGEFIGEIAYHYDSCTNGFMADVIIHADFRGNGYGSKALDMLCSAAKENGISALYDDISIDNPAAGLFLRHGFKEQYRTDKIIMLRKDL